MKAHRSPEKTNVNNAWAIHVQCLHGCSPYGGCTKDASAILAPTKMSVPPLPAGIEQPHMLACVGVPGCDLRTLRIIANRACVTQIVRLGPAPQSPWNDVIDFKRLRTQLLLQLAVLAAALCSFSDKPSKGQRDVRRRRHRQSPIAQLQYSC
jgi:hypothetical protein